MAIAYLLMGLGGNKNPGPLDPEVETAISAVNNQGNFRIWASPVIEYIGGERVAPNRLFFEICQSTRDDKLACLFAESVLISSQFFYGPISEIEPEFVCFPFERDGIDMKAGILEFQLDNLISRSLDYTRESVLAPSIRNCWVIEDRFIAKSILLGSFLVDDFELRLAIAFLQVAQSAFFVGHGKSLSDALAEGSWSPISTLDLVRWETSFFNTYRSVEAIVGDPSKKEEKYHAKLNEVGVDPFIEVGWRTKQPIGEVIRQMSKVRDKRVAHGSTRSRGITLGDMVEYQECARFVIEAAIRKMGMLGSLAT